ncbi:tryptophan ABC transporter substrate-binding protein [Aerococcus urinae]|uniref:ABC transporter substrate-binding protein n=1 Tax=Aerococcus urinae TaxID=1376 RepID=A0A0X8FF02_9LACT|nr:tryptophan ABC transporter substrate-binding protein [Aerococcus urinae]AMB96107.1 ABC transporter substrate-binding protein [Aerococcus urinae]MCY3033148.1 ABC transporter substrate-binding protein [Aerococcus urinae]MCY3038380.1 ABC transporter substrate-binding protein [Aerococcus urinae]MCY3045409.1 ABC transporter substrate-binding protein [Aerococcus urinae]MCY3048649.1 ABC transporter substrate-binding protein [Aerococcus urinae]
MKKITSFGVILITALAVLFLAMPTLIQHRTASENQAKTNVSQEDIKDTDHKIRIGLLQLTEHPALDDIRQGVYDQLAERGYVDGENVEIDFANGQGDQNNLKMLSDKMVSDGAEYLVGIATPAAQALKNVANDQVPVVMAAVSDPVGAGLVKDLDQPGFQVTGVRDVPPVKEQFDLIKRVMPDIKTVGIIYNSSETNAQNNVRMAKEHAKELGLNVVEKTITSTNDLAQVAEQLAQEVEAIWVPNDNSIASSMNTLISVTDHYKIPVFPVVDTMVVDGGMATVGLNQYQLGVDSANVLADLIEGADPRNYSVVIPEKKALTINSKKANELGIEIPSDVVNEATDVAKEGK